MFEEEKRGSLLEEYVWMTVCAFVFVFIHDNEYIVHGFLS